MSRSADGGQPNAALRWLFRAPTLLYHGGGGHLLGHRFLLLVHIGRRTGRRHETVLEVMEYRENGPELLVMSAFGRKADWLRNIEAARSAEVTIGSRHFTVVHRLLDSDEAVGVVQSYEQRNRLAAPLIRIVLSRLLGWSYHGLDSERRRLVAQLPLVALRPRPAEEHPISGACGSFL